MSLWALIACLLLASSAEGAGGSSGLESWWRRIHDELDEMARAKRIVPPTPVEVHWRARELWAGELPGPVLDMHAVDLNGDGRDELVLLSSRELLVYSRSRGLFDIRSRAPLPEAPASIRPRDPIGSLGVVEEGGEIRIRARSSERGMAGSYRPVDGALVLEDTGTDYPLCHEASIAAAPGRNYFLGKSVQWPGSDAPPFEAELYSARCTRGQIDRQGYPVQYLSQVSRSGTLSLRCRGQGQECQAMRLELSGVGYAHLAVDANRDGAPELLSSGAGAPGAPDRIIVTQLRDEGQAKIYEKEFAGGVVAMAAGDFDGDRSPDIVAAVHEQGKVRLWLLN